MQKIRCGAKPKQSCETKGRGAKPAAARKRNRPKQRPQSDRRQGAENPPRSENGSKAKPKLLRKAEQTSPTKQRPVEGSSARSGKSAAERNRSNPAKQRAAERNRQQRENGTAEAKNRGGPSARCRKSTAERNRSNPAKQRAAERNPAAARKPAAAAEPTRHRTARMPSHPPAPDPQPENTAGAQAVQNAGFPLSVGAEILPNRNKSVRKIFIGYLSAACTAPNWRKCKRISLYLSQTMQ